MAEKRKDAHGRVLREGESHRADGTYQYRYTDNYGKRRYIYSVSLSKLRIREEEIKKAGREGLDYCAGEITLLALAEKYLSQKQGMRYNTRVNYQFVKNILKNEEFSYRKIKTIKPSDAKEWFIKLHNDGRRYSTIQSIRGVVKPAFDMAVEEDIVRKNPFLFPLTSIIPNDTEERKPLTPEQEESFLQFLRKGKNSRKYYDVVVILLGTGLRISELCGLTISDLDFKHRRLRVERQLVRTIHCAYYIEKPKTESGRRFIPMSDEVYHAFRHVLKERPTPKVEIIVDGISGFLFLDKEEKPKVAGHFEHALKRIADNYNEVHSEPLAVTPHVLRHTFCTRLARAGMPIKELQYLMGHSDAGTTLQIYTHLEYDAAEKSFTRIMDSVG